MTLFANPLRENTRGLSLANRLRDERKFKEALSLYFNLAKQQGQTSPLLYHISTCLLGLGEFEKAAQASKLAFQKTPDFWQAQALYTKALRQTDPNGLATEQAINSLLKRHASEPHARANAELQLAELYLTVFCDAKSAANYAQPWLNNPLYAEQARRIYLMSRLYWRTEDDHTLSAMSIDYARQFIAQAKHPPQIQPAKRKRKRIGLISKMLEAGPVYYLTISTFRDMAKKHDLVLFNRSPHENWATEHFREIVTKEIDCRQMNWQDLAQTLRDADLDVLFELSGWTDPEGLKAVSTKPARKIYKWVGGQSMTTGLDCFDGYLTDQWQSPKGAQALHTEPLIMLEGGYVRYTPPSYIPKPKRRKDRGTVGIIGNPLKLNHEVIDGLITRSQKGGPLAHVKELRFIDRRYANPRIRARAESLLTHFHGKVTWITPQNHEHLLQELSMLEAVLDTSPYTMGLTAREALHFGAKIIAPLKSRILFSSCHSNAACQAHATSATTTEIKLPSV